MLCSIARAFAFPLPLAVLLVLGQYYRRRTAAYSSFFFIPFSFFSHVAHAHAVDYQRPLLFATKVSEPEASRITCPPPRFPTHTYQTLTGASPFVLIPGLYEEKA